MTKHNSPAAESARAIIEKEKRLDRLVRRVCVAAWSVTFVIVLLFTAMIGAQVAPMFKAFEADALPFSVVVGSAMPLIVIVGFLSLLIATLSTVGIFLRMRTASLAEIQLRLAALEDMLGSQKDYDSDRI
jgi:hypothetical protein